MIARNDQQLKALIPNVDSTEEYQNLISLVYKKGSYWTYHSKSLMDDSFKNHADRVWKIVKYECHENKKINHCQVKQGDVIKFGRVRFQIKKLVTDVISSMQSLEDEDIPQRLAPVRPNAVLDSSMNHLRPITTLENDQ